MTASEYTQADQRENILLIGDLLIDRTFYVDVTKLSPEAPVPVAMLTGNPVDTPGGAGLAAAFSAVHKIPIIFGTYTSVETASWMSNLYNIPIIYPCIHSDNTNAIKTRYIDNERHYHLLRVDSDLTVTTPFQSEADEEEWFRQIEQEIQSENIGIVALLDYRKGLFNKSRSQRLIDIAHKFNIPVYVDTRCNKLLKFKDADILKLNKDEFTNGCAAFGLEDTSLRGASPYEMAQTLNLEHLIITLGPAGASVFTPTQSYVMPFNMAAPKHEGSPDVTGCGDVFDVTFCYHWGIRRVGIQNALIAAVETATRFAYQPIGERLNVRANI